MEGIEEELEKFRQLPIDVMKELPDILLPAEFYMINRIGTFQGDLGKEFTEQQLKDRYFAVFSRAIDLCRSDRDMPLSVQEILAPDPYVFDIDSVNKVSDYLVYRMNGGALFEDFAQFRPDIQMFLVSSFQPAEVYLQSRLYEGGEEAEFCARISLAEPERWNFYHSITWKLSTFCGRDAPEELKDQELFDTAMDYAIERLLL